MAQISSLEFSGSNPQVSFNGNPAGAFELPTTENTSSSGFMWYSDPTIYYSALAGVWCTSQSLPRCRRAGGAFGAQDGAIFAGGCLMCCDTRKNSSTTEVWNGTTWDTGLIMTNEHGNGVSGNGTTTAGLIVGGCYNQPGDYGGMQRQPTTEEYNGSSWSSGGNVITPRSYAKSVGTQDATLFFGGNNSPSGCGCVEEYNGSSWSTGTTIPFASCYTTYGFGEGVNDAVYTYFCDANCTSKWNGISWSTISNPLINSPSKDSSFGTSSNLGIIYGESTYNSRSTERYDGTTWSTSSPSNAYSNLGGCGMFGTGPGNCGMVIGGTGNYFGAEQYTENVWVYQIYGT